MDTSTPTQGGPELGRALEAALEAARVAVERLFSSARAVRVAAVFTAAEAQAADEAAVLAATFDVGNPAEGRLALLAPVADAGALSAALLGRVGEAALDRDGREAFVELANIVASAFLNGIARVSGLKLVPSVPSMHEAAQRTLLESCREDGEVMLASVEVELAGSRPRLVLVATRRPEAVGRLEAALRARVG